MSLSPLGVTAHLRPQRIAFAGRPLTVCRPDLPAETAADPGIQPPLPLEGAQLPADRAPDLAPARRWVGMLGRVIVEVLVGRRPAAQLCGLLDDRSVAYLAAWANRGTLRPRRVGATHLEAVTATRVEGWITFHAGEREFVAVLCLHRDGARWTCRDLRVVAPAGGVAA